MAQFNTLGLTDVKNGRKANNNVNTRSLREVIYTSSYDTATILTPALGTDWFIAFDSRVVMGGVPPFRLKLTRTTHVNRKRAKLSSGALSDWQFVNPLPPIYSLEMSFK